MLGVMSAKWSERFQLVKFCKEDEFWKFVGSNSGAGKSFLKKRSKIFLLLIVRGKAISADPNVYLCWLNNVLFDSWAFAAGEPKIGINRGNLVIMVACLGMLASATKSITHNLITKINHTSVINKQHARTSTLVLLIQKALVKKPLL